MLIFLIFQVYEVTGESFCQLILQGSVLIFEFCHHELNEPVLTASDRKTEIASVFTSGLAIMFGVSSHWLFKSLDEEKQTILLRIKLTLRGSIDIILRISAFFSIMVISLRWVNGAMPVIVAILFLNYFGPFLMALLTQRRKKKVKIFDRTSILFPMTWQTPFEADYMRPSRMRNKMVGVFMIAIFVVLEILEILEVVKLPIADPW